MKFANIDSNTIAIRPGIRKNIFLNFGDHIQIEAINYLYKKMEISDKDIIKIPIQSLQDYDGEDVYLPLNFVMFFSSRTDGSLFSPRIHPIFLAINLEQPPTDKVAAYLRKFAPIGCRDEITYQFLIEKEIPAYLHGCLTCTFPYRPIPQSAENIYFVDAPDVLLEKIPDDMRSKVRKISNGFYGDLDDLGCSPREYCLNNYYELAEKAALVVTKRLHIASPCIAMGIPVVLAQKNSVTTYSWIDKYIPVYQEKMYDDINWNPVTPAVSDEEKNFILSVAIHHINSVVNKTPIDWNLLNKMTEYYLDRPYANEYSKVDSIKLLIDEILEILRKRVACHKCHYAIWGITALAEYTYEVIKKSVPEAELILAIDTYKTGNFQGHQLVSPENITRDNSIFYIIPAEGDIIRAAHVRFAELGISEDNCYYIYEKFRKNVRDI